MKIYDAVASGKPFTRPKYKPFNYFLANGDRFVYSDDQDSENEELIFTPEDILADDWELEEANATTNDVPSSPRHVETRVILRPLVLNYIKKKETFYTYSYTKECDPQKLDKLIDEVNEMETELLKKVCELLGAVCGKATLPKRKG